MKAISIISILFILSTYLKGQELFKMPENVQTRWSSPENPNAEKGKAGLVNYGRKGRASVAHLRILKTCASVSIGIIFPIQFISIPISGLLYTRLAVVLEDIRIN
jgi:hypothetical protein